MGTNFYMRRNDTKAVLLQMLNDDKSVDEIRDFLNSDDCVGIHLAKTSCGWLPSFEAHSTPSINSVADIKTLYDTGKYEIVDEYDTPYTWDEFDKRVLQFNGGTVNRRVITPISRRSDDPDMPDHTPVSHFEYGNGKYANEYFRDPEGYEFTAREFC